MRGRCEQVRAECGQGDCILVLLPPQELGECLPGLLRWVSSLKSLSTSHAPFLSDFLRSCRIHRDWALPGGAESLRAVMFLPATWRVVLSLSPVLLSLAHRPSCLPGVRDTLQLAAPPPDTPRCAASAFTVPLASQPPRLVSGR